MKYIFSILILVPLLSIGQLPHFEHIDILKNVRNYEVHFTYQDTDGYIWFGTTEGLLCYDGTDYRKFTVKDSLYQNEISALIQDTANNFWIGHTTGEISFGKPGGFEKWFPEEGLPKKEITTFYIDNENNVWFGTAGEGAYYFNFKRNRLYNINTDDGLSDNYIYKIKQDSANNFWIATDYGLNIYNKKEREFSIISMKDGLPDNIVKDFCFVDANHILVGMEDEGLTILNLNDTTFSFPINWQFGSINNFVFLHENIWISTKRKGIIELEKNNGSYFSRQFSRNEGLFTSRTNNIFLDREENLWVTAKRGVIQSASGVLTFLDNNDGLDLKNLYNFIIDDNNTYWIAAEDGLYYMIKDERGRNILKEYYINPELKGKTFTSLYQDLNKNIWFGTYGYGVFKMSGDQDDVINITSENGLGNNNIISITGKNDKVIFSTLGGGISIYDYQNPDTLITFNSKSGLVSNYVYCSYIDESDRLWIAMDGGLAYIQNNTVYDIEKLNELNITEIYGITGDRNNNIWITTASQGIVKYNSDTLVIFNEESGLHSLAYSNIIFDGKDKILLTSESGIDLLDVNTNTISYYGEEFGFKDFDPILNAIYRDKNDNIWITGRNSILKYNTYEFYHQITKPKILITSKKNFFDDIPNDKYTFSYNKNHFTFEYIGLWFKAPEQIKYRYKLENYDLDWSQPNQLKSITYSNLAPGSYTFKVQVTNETGNWFDGKDNSYEFLIRPPFWQTWWFISASIVSLIGLVWFIIVYRTRALERAKDELEEEVKKRTAKIQLQKEEIEAQRDEIEKKNEDILDSIQYASRIQTAVIPPLFDLTSVFKDAFVLNKPRDIVSGDFYWFARRDNLIFIAAADCTGHGVPGAFMSMLGIASLNEIVNSVDCQCDSAYILNRLRDKIKVSLRQEGKIGEAKDGMDIAFCIIDLQNMEISYAGAYNPLLLIRDNELSEFKADKMPIGIHLNDKKNFKNHKIALKPNDRFYLFSDGYVDQFGGEKGRKFLSKNFKNLLLENHQKDFSDQHDILEETITSWMGNHHQIDDMLVIGFKI